ncbi:MAG: DUF4926 domain-containing protein [Limisphaerales bacterium]
MIKEHDCPGLTTNVPDEGLEAGDIGTVVHIRKGGEAYPERAVCGELARRAGDSAPYLHWRG